MPHVHLLPSPGQNPSDRTVSKRAVRISLGIIGAVFLIEAVGGWLTNSLALLADAGHLLTDIAALGMVLLAFWFAARPTTPERTYGYYRAEILAALANGLALWLVSAYILVQAYRRLAEPPEISSGPMLVIAFAGLLAQVGTTLVLRRAAQENLNVRGAFVHVATDVLQSIGVIIAGLRMLFFGWYIADPIISAVIALAIIYTGGRIVLQSTHVLLEGTPSHVDTVALEEALLQADLVRSVHDLHTWSITSGYNAMSAHVVLEDEVAPEEGQRLLERLRDTVINRYGIGHVTIQLEGGFLECAEDQAHTPQSSGSATS